MRHRPGDVGLTARAVTQECTQIGQNGLSVPLWGICVHCCDARIVRATVGTRRSVHRSAKMAPRSRFGAFVYTVGPWAWVVGGLGIAIVYTNGRIGPLRAVLGHLCTLLRLELRQVARAPQPPWRAGGTPSLAPPAWSGRQALHEWRRCQVGIFAEASAHTNPRRVSYYRQFLRRVAPNRSRSAERGRPGRRSRL